MAPSVVELLKREVAALPEAQHRKLFKRVEASQRFKLHELRPAAVLILLCLYEEGDWRIVLTRRQERLMDHPGQIAFPGGRWEPGDRSPEATAVREAQEEIGLMADHLHLLGRMPVYPTVTGYKITPVVAWSPQLQVWRAQPDEVAEIFTLPVQHLISPENWHQTHIAIGNDDFRYWEIPFENHRIWGATAGMLHALRPCLARAWGNQEDE